MKRFLAFVMAAVATLTLAGPVVAETTDAFSGTLVIPGLPGQVEGRAVFRGAISDVCTEEAESFVATPAGYEVVSSFTCSKGTFTIVSKGSQTSGQFHPVSCVRRGTQAGTFEIVSGTGAYEDLRGTGTTSVRGVTRLHRDENGCIMNRPPIKNFAHVELIGTVTS